MKKTFFAVAFATLFFVACKEEKKDGPADKGERVKAVNALPYSINYASEFEIGDQKYAKQVLDAWKDYDNGTLKNSAGIFADSVMMIVGNGMVFNGKKDSVINTILQHRNSFASATSSVDAITVLKTKGKDETWVCIWGKEIDVAKDGKKDSVELQENWMFNKDGKVTYVSQYERGYPKTK
jgi:hypothetical protein